MTNDLVALVMVTEDHQLFAEPFLGDHYALGQLFLGECTVERRQRVLHRRVSRNNVILARSRAVMRRQRGIEIPGLLR